MIQVHPLKKRSNWPSHFLLFLGIYMILTQNLSESRYAIGSVVFLTIGSWREKISIDAQGLLYESRLLLVFRMKTRCLFAEADRLELKPFSADHSMLEWLQGRKLKRVLIAKKDVPAIKSFLGPYL